MTTKRLTRITYFTMLTIVAGMAKIALPSYPILPYTLQCVVAVSSGLVLGSKDGLLSQLAYLLLGIVGLPIFVNGGGYVYAVDPTFGYVIAFLCGAFFAGFLKSRFKTLSIKKLFFAAFFALVLIYVIGMTYQFILVLFYLNEGLSFALNSLAPLPFYIIVDAIVLYLICLAYPRLLTVIGDSQPFEKEQQTKTQVKSDKNA